MARVLTASDYARYFNISAIEYLVNTVCAYELLCVFARAFVRVCVCVLCVRMCVVVRAYVITSECIQESQTVV